MSERGRFDGLLGAFGSGDPLADTIRAFADGVDRQSGRYSGWMEMLRGWADRIDRESAAVLLRDTDEDRERLERVLFEEEVWEVWDTDSRNCLGEYKWADARTMIEQDPAIRAVPSSYAILAALTDMV